MSELASWQRGHDLEKLRALAAPFKARHKPLVFGAFGLTKERDIAEALEKERLISVGEPAAGVAILKSVPGYVEDFRGEVVRLGGGGIYVSAFAAHDVEAASALLSQLEFKASSCGSFFVEIFEEDMVARQALKAHGFRWWATKISAGSEVKGIYSPRGPEEALPAWEDASLEVLDRGFLLEDDRLAILDELEAAASWEQHYSSYNKRKSWTSFALRGFSDEASFIIKPAEMSKSWKEEHPELLGATPRWTSAAEKFPAAMRVIGRLGEISGQEFDRVRFMKLAPKGELTRHADITDREAGVADGKLTRLHIPIVTHPEVKMIGWSARGHRREIHFPEMALCYLDQRKPHAVKNPVGVERIHIVADLRGSPKLRQLIGRARNGSA